MVPTSRRGAEYTVLPALLLKQLKHSFNSRASGMVPGERTVGQRWLTVRLAVGSQRTAFPAGRDLL